jgi:UPF0755 protein
MAGSNETPPTGRGRRWAPRSAREQLQPVAAPEPPPRRRGGGFLGQLSAFFTFLVFAAVVVGGALVYAQGLVTAPGPLAQEKTVFIPRGSGRSDIAVQLEQEGVISSALMFEVTHLLAGSPNLRAGEYLFKQQASLKDVRDTLTEGRAIQHSLTIPEGLTSEQIVARIRENEILVGEIRNIPREGSLLPDTYRFERGMSREQFLVRMEREQRAVLNTIWQKRAADIPVKTPAELVTLASIVEKETGKADERPRVAGVFINRLNRNMRLESDPTIIYGLVGGRGSLGRPILASEIRQPTAYNTYVISGLPPGPIGNPGRAAMEAVANPMRHRELFFVADGTGGHTFSETYEQHLRAVARWREIERSQGGNTDRAPAGTAPPAAPAAGQPRTPGQRSDLPAPEIVIPGAVPLMEAATLDLSPPAQRVQTPALDAAPRPGPTAAQAAAPRPAASTAAPAIPPPAATAGTTALPAGVSAFAIPMPSMDVIAQFLPPEGAIDESNVPMASQTGVESFPLSANRRQEMRRNAQQAGTGVPATAFAGIDEAVSVPALSPAAGQPGTAGARTPRVVDASAGTARDPLRNRSFDLSTVKVVPNLR